VNLGFAQQFKEVVIRLQYRWAFPACPDSFGLGNQTYKDQWQEDNKDEIRKHYLTPNTQINRAISAISSQVI
jgi:hypothetical protein